MLLRRARHEPVAGGVGEHENSCGNACVLLAHPSRRPVRAFGIAALAVDRDEIAGALEPCLAHVVLCVQSALNAESTGRVQLAVLYRADATAPAAERVHRADQARSERLQQSRFVTRIATPGQLVLDVNRRFRCPLPLVPLPEAAGFEEKPTAIAVHVLGRRPHNRQVHLAWTDIFGESLQAATSAPPGPSPAQTAWQRCCQAGVRCRARHREREPPHLPKSGFTAPFWHPSAPFLRRPPIWSSRLPPAANPAYLHKSGFAASFWHPPEPSIPSLPPICSLTGAGGRVTATAVTAATAP